MLSAAERREKPAPARGGLASETAMSPEPDGEGLAPDPSRMAAKVVIALRRHPHLNNVLTHISGSNWTKLEQALTAVLDPSTRPRDLPPLARNLLDLLCADRGVTGRIMKPYFHEWLALALPAPQAERIIANTVRLFAQVGQR